MILLMDFIISVHLFGWGWTIYWFIVIGFTLLGLYLLLDMRYKN